MDGLRRHRIIPAYAGSTPPSATLGGSCRDHPRIRGEHPGRTRPAPGTGRIIPAYAGSTSFPGSVARIRRDHPRIRGEHFPTPGGTGPCQGSSPHTRGAPPDSPGGGTAPPDHPRIRGEHRRCHRRVRRRAGSSPHTRGARAAAGRSGGIGGIIPAYAGSTTVLGRVLDPRKDHPRIRGEHLVRAPAADEATGSSPHTRGARLIASWWAFRSGIIPAYAGSTRPRRLPGPGDRDHPRIRGEHG